jgi:3-oxoacyl-[acyl-carrier-protein] synthase-3
MHFRNVCLESIGYVVPDEIVTSEEIESRLDPLYRRLKLPEGRLELMTGIRERRFWPEGLPPSGISVQSGLLAIEAAGIEPERIGALVHASVCRDHLEPATACSVHHRLGLPRDCLVYDVSNACLGILNGMIQVAQLIELGAIQAGLVVGTETGRGLVENTIHVLNDDASLSREDVKLAVASLTIGSASAAVLLVDRELSTTHNRLLGGAWRTNTEHHSLCHGREDATAAGNLRPLMQTDSERLLAAGVQLARECVGDFLRETDWSLDSIDKTFCHQVGQAHKRLLFQTLGLDPSIDFSTFEFLGNTGSCALPVTMAMGMERGHLERGDQVALLGIGSGLNVIMLGVDWQSVPAGNASSAQGRMARPMMSRSK